jgi:hypothetical protein
MPAIVHVLTGPPDAIVDTTVAAQRAAGDDITIVLVGRASAPASAKGLTVRHAPDEVSWSGVLDLIFAADQVVCW